MCFPVYISVYLVDRQRVLLELIKHVINRKLLKVYESIEIGKGIKSAENFIHLYHLLACYYAVFCRAVGKWD